MCRKISNGQTFHRDLRSTQETAQTEMEGTMIAKSSRIAIVASAVWLLVVYAALAVHYSNKMGDGHTEFLIFGILPVLVWNGIRWIRK
jgi:hypothetical protein